MIRPGGFCPSHSGKGDQIAIAPKDEEIIGLYLRSLLQWMIKLKEDERFFSYTEMVLDYFRFLAEESGHYIRLLSNLLLESLAGHSFLHAVLRLPTK